MLDLSPGASAPASWRSRLPEQAHVARLLQAAGLDLETALGAYFLAAAAAHAGHWAEQALYGEAPLDPETAAVLGLRSFAGQVIAWAGDASHRADGLAVAAASVCLELCGTPPGGDAPEDTRQDSRQESRRWGQGATPAWRRVRDFGAGQEERSFRPAPRPRFPMS